MNGATLWEILSYPFVTRALIVGVLVSLCAALLGVVLVLKRYTLIGHGLADVGFASLSLALALGLEPLAVSAPVVVGASFAIMSVSQRKGVSGDVAIGIAATAALAFGVLIATMARGFNMDVYGYMFGSILAMTLADVIISAAVSVLVIALFALFFNRLFLVTSSEDFARASGVNVSAYQFLISFLTALTVVVGMRMMGTLLISSLIILPAVIARRLARGFRGVVITAAVVSVVCFITGLLLSFIFNLPTGASIVLVNIAVLALATLFRKIHTF